MSASILKAEQNMSGDLLTDEVCSSQFEHYLLLIVVLFVCICGILGNSLVIFATLYRKAFSGDNISIVFVRNLATADLIYIIIQVIPEIVVRFNNHEWVLGDTMCFISAHAVYIPGVANINFIFSISLYRLLSCKFPFRFRQTVTFSQANVFSVVVWVWSIIPSLVYLCHRTEAVFQASTSTCDVVFEGKSFVNLVLAGPFLLIPFIVLIACNIWLYCIAKNAAVRMGKSAKQALLTIGSVSVLFVISWLPYLIRKIAMMITKSELNWPLRPDILFYELSIFGNPIIYTIVNERFKNFLKVKILSIVKPEYRGRTFTYSSNSTGGQTNTELQKTFKKQISHQTSNHGPKLHFHDNKIMDMPAAVAEAKI